nr:ceramidase domain-containing protein [Candidatus Sigynarchaeota archaeon]
MLAYILAWMAIFMGFSIIGWPGDIRKCVAHQTCFCEYVDLNTLWGQPVSSLTNFAYVISGLAIVIFLTMNASSISPSMNGPHDNYKRITPYSFLYAILTVNVGIGSLFMHASQRKWTGTFDVFAMNMFIVYVLLYSITEFLKMPLKRFLVLYAVIEASMFVFYQLDLIKANTVFGIIVAATTGWEVAFQIICRKKNLPIRRDWKYLLFSVLFFVSGFVVWEMEDLGIIPCDPFSLLQAHGIWHVITAIATFMIFLYIRSENK